jgi:hypothetical protein
VIRGGDGRHDRALDETAGTTANDRRDLLLRRGRHRVQIDVEMIRGQVGGETLRCVASRCCRDDGEDHARVVGERAWRFDEARARLRRPHTHAVIVGAVRCLDIEGDERRRTDSAKTAREVEPCFAETKQSDPWLMIAHSLFLSLTPREPSLHVSLMIMGQSDTDLLMSVSAASCWNSRRAV